MAKYTDDIAKLGELTLNDTAANTYLTMLVNIGILGIVAYLTFLIFIKYWLIKTYRVINQIIGENKNKI